MTRFTVSESCADYGENCYNAKPCAEAIARELTAYARKNFLDVEIVIVPEKQSLGNRSTGDPDIIAELDNMLDENWIDWVPSGAANCEEV
ncbi:hypothetical protein LCGC14_0842230 [marine sediment metagenome]|uniref:Uncharacterized protein n=1 Tax=marine sediment metagenome TaxID=412755 RepID=A0A0F9PHG5_9ZZZZ